MYLVTDIHYNSENNYDYFYLHFADFKSDKDFRFSLLNLDDNTVINCTKNQLIAYKENIFGVVKSKSVFSEHIYDRDIVIAVTELGYNLMQFLKYTGKIRKLDYGRHYNKELRDFVRFSSMYRNIVCDYFLTNNGNKILSIGDAIIRAIDCKETACIVCDDKVIVEFEPAYYHIWEITDLQKFKSLYGKLVLIGYPKHYLYTKGGF